jgi:hypothetical protein
VTPDEELFDRVWRWAALRERGLTRHDLASDFWDAPFRGVRRWAGNAGDPVAAVIAAAAALLPPDCCLGGWAAAYQRGIRYLDGNIGYPGALPVPLLITEGHQLRRRPGIWPVRTTTVRCADFDLVHGIPSIKLDLAGRQQMCWARNVVEAVVVADMVTSVRTGEPTIPMADLANRVDTTRRVRGIVQARAALELASDRSASPEESRTRMVWILDAQLPKPLVNAPVFTTTGALLGFADLLEPEAGYVHEIDGGQHRALAQHTDDNIREEAFEAHGLVVSRSTSRDRANADELRRRLRSTWRRAMARDRSADRWTLQPPPGWREPRPTPPCTTP